MGHKGFLGSAAAGASLFAAVAVLLVLVSAYVGFRGGEDRDVEEVAQEARLSPAPRIETAAAQRVVVGSRGQRNRRAGRSASRTAPRRSGAVPVRSSGGSAADVRRPPASETAPAQTRAAPAPAAAAPEEQPQAAPTPERRLPAPVAEAVEDVTAPVDQLADRVGDVLPDVGAGLP